ncbi:MAG: FAD-dependent monooxygenase [Bacteroidia bacterium]|nr:FAD-dependent monooxygenase [Bacteroidia bacterium]
MKEADVIVIGGGLGGWCSAIHLRKAGLKVMLIEKRQYPFHKFCGEYLSAEVEPYLSSLGLSLEKSGANRIRKFKLSSHTGKYVTSKLSIGGFGIRRYTLDYQLAILGQKEGIKLIEGKEVRKIQFESGYHKLICKDKSSYRAELIIGAYGKRTGLDKELKRDFLGSSSSYIGVKQYFDYDYPAAEVSLHNFEGGYCGMARMEDGSLNLCYLSKKEILNKYGGIDELESKVLSKNPFIKEVFHSSRKLLDKPIVISNIYFEEKNLVENHVLMCGDAAGMIFPLAGNGMAMSIHAAKILAEQIVLFKQGKLSRTELENSYQKEWNDKFASRLSWGRNFQPFMGSNRLSSFAVSSLKLLPPLLPAIIKRTHGHYLDAYTQ